MIVCISIKCCITKKNFLVSERNRLGHKFHLIITARRTAPVPHTYQLHRDLEPQVQNYWMSLITLPHIHIFQTSKTSLTGTFWTLRGLETDSLNSSMWSNKQSLPLFDTNSKKFSPSLFLIFWLNNKAWCFQNKV